METGPGKQGRRKSRTEVHYEVEVGHSSRQIVIRAPRPA